MRTELEIQRELAILEHEYANFTAIYNEKVEKYQRNLATFGPLANTSEMDYYFNLREEVQDKITLLKWVLN